MNGAIPNQQQYPPQPIEPQAPIPSPQSKQNKLGIAILFIVFSLILLAVILNYLNIFPLSSLFPNQLGFLPHRTITSDKVEYTQPNNISQKDVPNGTSQAKQTLINFLPTILTPSFLPKYPFDVTLIEDKVDKEKLNASWNIKGGGTTWTVFPNPSNAKKITSLDVFFEKIQIASPSVELAKSEVNKIFSSNPKGEWGCNRDPLNERKLYCENFWEDKDVKKGLGFLIINTSPFRGRLVFSFCEHSKEEPITYSWKSCRAEFAQTGVE